MLESVHCGVQFFIRTLVDWSDARVAEVVWVMSVGFFGIGNRRGQLRYNLYLWLTFRAQE